MRTITQEVLPSYEGLLEESTTLNMQLMDNEIHGLAYFSIDEVSYYNKLSNYRIGTPLVLRQPKEVEGIIFSKTTPFIITGEVNGEKQVVYLASEEVCIMQTNRLDDSLEALDLRYALATIDHDNCVPEGMSGFKNQVNAIEASVRQTYVKVTVDGRKCYVFVELANITGELATYKASLTTTLEGEEVPRVLAVAEFSSSVFNVISADILEAVFM